MEVKMVQCINGHYFNSAIHAVCPECGAQEASAAAGGIGHTVAAGSAAGMPQGGIGHTMAAGGASGMPQGGIGHTMPAGGAAGIPQGGIGKTVAAGGWSSMSPGPTVPVMSGMSDSAPGTFRHTEIGGSLGTDTVVSEPVVGWLVCIDGPVRGCDFRIHAGYNYIGRETGDIHISGDMQISHQNHAMIAYDSVDRAFYFGPSGGRNLVRVNGKTVLSAVEIHTYDVITIGTSQLIFVALCSERFDWSKGVTDGDANA